MDRWMHGCMGVSVLICFTHAHICSCLQRSVPADGCMREHYLYKYVGDCRCLYVFYIHRCMYAFMSVARNTSVTSRYSRKSRSWSLVICRKFGNRFLQPCNLCFLAVLDWQAANPVPLLWLCTSPPLFQALPWKAWIRTSKVSKARLAVTVSTVVKQKNAWQELTF